MSSTFARYLIGGVVAAVLMLVFLAYLQPSFLLELGTSLQLC